jgi:hypothetical protein
MSERPRVLRVPDSELRRLFIALGFQELIDSGALTETLLSNRHPSPNKANEPDCTRLQLLAYADKNGLVDARLHRYLRQDGTLGASGRADPKYLFYAGVIYKQEPSRQ